MKYLGLCLAVTLCGYALVAEPLALSPQLPQLINSLDGAKPSSGKSYELLVEAARRAKITLNFQIQPWARALATASETKNVLLYPVSRTPEREAMFEWLGPVNKLDYGMFILSKNGNKVQKDLSKITTENIGVLRNDAAHAYLGTNLGLKNLEVVSEYEPLIQMFLNERFTYLAVVPRTLYDYLDSKKIERSSVTPLFTLNYTKDPYSYVVVAKGSDPKMIEALSKAFASMQKDGTWDKISKRYDYP